MPKKHIPFRPKIIGSEIVIPARVFNRGWCTTYLNSSRENKKITRIGFTNMMQPKKEKKSCFVDDHVRVINKKNADEWFIDVF